MKQLEKIIPNLDNSVLSIGFDEESKFLKKIKENKKVKELYTIVGSSRNTKKIKKKFLSGKKSIDVKKLSKTLKKKTFDYTIVNFEVIKPFFRAFVKSSLKVSNKTIYLYIEDNDYDINEIIYRYNRYNNTVKKLEESSTIILEFDIKNKKNKTGKSILFKIRDLSYDFVEFVANIIIG